MAKTEGLRMLSEWMAKDEARTQAFVASQIGISAPAVSVWLRGAARPEPQFRSALRLLAGIPEEAWLTSTERHALEIAAKRIATGTEG